MTRPITVRPALPAEQLAALRLLYAETAEDDPQERTHDTLSAASQGEMSLEHLLLAERDGQAVGAGFFTVQPGRVAFVWPPGIPAEMPDRRDIQEALLTAIGHRLESLQICLGQVLLEPADSALRECLESNGFPHLTDLHYMLRPVDSAPPGKLPQTYEVETFDPAANAERFTQVLSRTYIDTQDCPELDGLRTAEDAMAGHQATGRFDPRLWRLFRQEGQDAGLLLINDHPDRELWEIVYLGVVPEFRGQGLGQAMVETAIEEAHQAGRPLVLAVDGRNQVARKIYRRCGFMDLTVQSVHVWQAAGRRRIPQSTNYAQSSGDG